MKTLIRPPCLPHLYFCSCSDPRGTTDRAGTPPAPRGAQQQVPLAREGGAQQEPRFPCLKKATAKQAQGREGLRLQPTLCTTRRRSVSAGTADGSPLPRSRLGLKGNCLLFGTSYVIPFLDFRLVFTLLSCLYLYKCMSVYMGQGEASQRKEELERRCLRG